MTTGLIAALVAVLALGFVEGWRRFYPSRPTWKRLRRTKGRLAVRLMRERFEQGAERGSHRVVAEVLAGLVIVWIAVSSLLDKRWYEVLTDLTPYVLVGIAVFRVPGGMREIAERMKEYEREVGEDPDEDWRDLGDDGPTALVL
ncbi:MAG: hypothetical protein ACLGIB_10575 [Actinomycetota bacterium]